MSSILRRSTSAGVMCLGLAAALVAAPVQRDAKSKDTKDAKDEDAQRPKLTLKAQPTVSLSPARVVLTAELAGGSNDYQDFYCPTVDWDWDDGTESEFTSDCDPYQPGKTAIKRKFTVEHIFKAGAHHVTFRLKRNDKTLVTASVSIQVQAGGADTDNR